MKSSTLLFRSLAIIIFIAGGAQLAGYLTYDAYSANETETNLLDLEQIETTPKENKSTQNTSEEELLLSTTELQGKWGVTYNSEEFTGTMVYDLKKEGKVINAYLVEYRDEEGYAEAAKPEKTLVIKKFDGKKGRGIYNVSYEGETYEVDCKITIVDDNTFQLSYDYYGYGDTEIWKKL